MKKKNKIIIGITIVAVAIITVIVGITVSNHQKTLKEAESISASVEDSKTDLIRSYIEQFENITSKEYKTEDEYKSAKNLLITLKDEINEQAEIKDNSEIVSLIENIDTSIKNYEDKIKSLTTTQATTDEVTEIETATTKNVTTTKQNSTTKQNTTKNTTTTKKETTTEKKNVPTYGTVVTTLPDSDDYPYWGWKAATVTYTWKIDEYGGYWAPSARTSMSSSEYDEWEKYAGSVTGYPSRDGNYEGEVISKTAWVWLG